MYLKQKRDIVYIDYRKQSSACRTIVNKIKYLKYFCHVDESRGSDEVEMPRQVTVEILKMKWRVMNGNREICWRVGDTCSSRRGSRVRAGEFSGKRDVRGSYKLRDGNLRLSEN